MSQVVVVGHERYKRRQPLGVLALVVVTVFVYWVVWLYKVNDEARRYLGDESIRPWMSVLAVVPGLILIVPPFISVYRTGERIRRMQQQAHVAKTVEPLLGLLCAFLTAITFVFAGGTALYYQSHLNRVWDGEAPDRQRSTEGDAGY